MDPETAGLPDPSIGVPGSSRCIACEEAELANVRDARPSQLLPIPHMALAGFPEGRSPRALTRRRLLQFGAAGVASVYAPKLLGWESVWESAVAEAATTPTSNALVVLYLPGGQDGLNVIVPNSSTDYPLYVAKRPVLHRAQGPTTTSRVGSTVVPGTGGELAFANPVVSSAAGGDNGDATHGFDVIYGDGLGGAGSNLVLLPAADYTPPNLSHFTSSDYWFSGDLNILSTGWLGRYLDVYGSRTNPLQGISIGGSLSKDLLPKLAPVCTIASLSTLGFSLNGPHGGEPRALDVNELMIGLAGATASPSNAQRARTLEAYQLATTVYKQTLSLGTATFGTGYYPTGSLGPQLQLAAFLLAANLGTRIITVHWGGFDTHGNQIQSQDPQLKELSVSLSAFLADLKARGIDNRVSVLMFSEFGRRVTENASAGTDHGAGGLMMLAGTPVKGGAGAFPGLSKLDENGDVLVPTDFRSVYQETISKWLGGDPAAVLPGGGAFPEVTRYDGTTGLFH
jgi:uncharacterized protein (DUF1501 family)